MKSILVLGATGFVGTHVSLALDKKDADMILACRNNSRLHPSLTGKEIRLGDITDNYYLRTLFRGIDTVINACAWSSMFGHALMSEQQFLFPTLRMIETAKASGVKRFVNLSSVSATDTTLSYDPNHQGKATAFWPHLDNVIKIENYLRQHASKSFQVINLRCGHFIGEHYGIGLLPILLPRLKTHLVPWINQGNTRIPLISDTDIAQAFVKAACSEREMDEYESFDIIGAESPLFKEIIEFIHRTFDYPAPHYSVSFSMAHMVGHFMELIDPIVPYDPLVTRSIVHLLKETGVDNSKAEDVLGYRPEKDWKITVQSQINEIHARQSKPMKMTKERE